MLSVDVTASPYNANPNGVADCTTALQSALTAVANAGGGELRFPPGVYLTATAILFNVGAGLAIAFRGAGERVSTLRTTTASATLVYCAAVNNVLVTELGLDLGNAASAVGIYTRGPITYRHGYVTGFDLGRGVWVQRAGRGVVLADVLFESDLGGGNTRTGTALDVDGAWDLECRDVRILGAPNGVKLNGTTPYVGGRASIRGLRVDGMWRLLPARTKTGGGTVTGTPSSWQDNGFTVGAGAVPDAVPEFTTVRAMIPLATGTIDAAGCVGGTLLAASASPDLRTLGLKRGDVARTATAVGLFTGATAANEVRVEGWLDRATLRPCASPTPGTAWTLYRYVGLGVATGGYPGGAGFVRTNAWQDVEGNAVTGATLQAAGAQYEVLIDHPNYQGVHAEAGYDGLRVIDPVVVASWSDGISSAARNTQVGDPFVTEGWDTGITLDGDESCVVNPVVVRQGARGVWAEGDGDVVHGGVLAGSPWISNVGEGSYDSQLILSSTGDAAQRVAGTFFNGRGYPLCKAGVAIATSRGAVVGCGFRGHARGAIKLYGANAAATLEGNDVSRDVNAGATLYYNGAVPQPQALPVQLATDDGPPTTGHWAVGQEAKLSAPLPDGTYAYLCTRAGALGPAWAQSTAYAVGAVVLSNGRIYECTTPGTSASSGVGPEFASGTGADGTVTWTRRPTARFRALVLG